MAVPLLLWSEIIGPNRVVLARCFLRVVSVFFFFLFFLVRCAGNLFRPWPHCADKNVCHIGSVALLLVQRVEISLGPTRLPKRSGLNKTNKSV